MSSATSVYLEGLIEECGGFSRFQWIMFATVIYSRISVSWTMMMMAFAGATPDWQCRFTNYSNPGTTTSIDSNNSYYTGEQCYPPENATVSICQEFRFSDSMTTVVSEWTLICDKDWIASTITTIQMAGLLVSCVASGHLADFIGRKPTFFLSLIILTVLNVASGFSTSWQMFAAFRFLLGVGIGAYATVFTNYLIEFIPAKQRSISIAFPAWAISVCVFGLVAMWLHDWKYLHFSTALMTLPCLCMWWYLPESFRFLVTHNRLDEAKGVICKIARINGKPEPNMSMLSYLVKEDLKVDVERKYTIRDVAKSPQLRKYTCLLGIAWFGRKWVTLVLLLFAGITGLVVAALQISDLEMKSSLINGFAIASKMGVGVGWSTLMILSTESYPTVVRNIGSGMLNSFARIGSMAAPQIVYLNSYLPGAMYFIFSGVMVMSAFGLYFMPETNKKPIEDGLATDKKAGKEMQSLQGHADETLDSR